MHFFTIESLIFVAIKCQIRQHKEAERWRIRPNYVHLVDLQKRRIKWEAFTASCLTFATARPQQLGHRGQETDGQEEEHVTQMFQWLVASLI